MSIDNIKKIDEYKYLIPKGTIPCMNVPGIFYADDVLMNKAIEEYLEEVRVE